MRTPSILTIVAAAHCLAIGGIFLMQGCGTTGGKTGEVAPPPVMPPSIVDTMPAEPVSGTGPGITQWPSETSSYVVRKGDSLSAIAKHYGVSVSEIVALNGLSNKNMIRVGQKLKLPGKLDVSSPVPAVKSTDSKKVSAGTVQGGTYVVQPGDCLSAIAVKNGVTTAAIIEANGLSGDRIIVGQKLVLPGVTVVKAAQKDVSTVAPGSVVKPVSVKPATIVKDREPSAPKAAVGTAPVTATVPAPAVKVAAVADNTVDEGAAEEPVAKVKPVITETHVVQKGEDLRRISMQWLVDEEKIRSFNNLPKNVVLKPGQELQIPLSE